MRVFALPGCTTSGSPIVFSGPFCAIPLRLSANGEADDVCKSNEPLTQPVTDAYENRCTPQFASTLCARTTSHLRSTRIPYRKAWPENYGRGGCDSPTLTGSLSSRERKAVRIAFKTKGNDPARLTRLYDLCAETGTSAFYDEDFPDQAVEPAAVLHGMLHRIRITPNEQP